MSLRSYREGDEDEIARTLNECFESEGRVRLSLFDAKPGQATSLFEDFFPKKPVMTFPADFW